MNTAPAGDSNPNELSTTDHIEFFFDPMCPWAWITSRFMVEVAEHRRLSITWRLISLAMLNARDGLEPPAPPWNAGQQAHPSCVERLFPRLRLGNNPAVTLEAAPTGAASYDRAIPIGTDNMRVLASVIENHTNADLGALYTAIGNRLHPGGRSSELFGDHPVHGAHLRVLSEAIDEVGLGGDLMDSCANQSLDELVRSETEEALRRTGEGVGAPVITYDPDHPEVSSYFGPVFNRIPRGSEAVALFDAVAGLALAGGMAEIKRTDRGEPDFA